MREVTQGFVTCQRPEDAKPMGNLETASQALLLAALKGRLAFLQRISGILSHFPLVSFVKLLLIVLPRLCE